MVQAARIENPSLFGVMEPALPAMSFDPRSFAAISTREEAEYLLMLDHSGQRQGGEWGAYLIEAIVGFVVWQNRPAGEITESDLDWFLGLVADAPSPNLPALLYALAREVNETPERLIALALRYPHGRCPGAGPAPERQTAGA